MSEEKTKRRGEESGEVERKDSDGDIGLKMKASPGACDSAQTPCVVRGAIGEGAMTKPRIFMSLKAME